MVGAFERQVSIYQLIWYLSNKMMRGGEQMVAETFIRVAMEALNQMAQQSLNPKYRKFDNNHLTIIVYSRKKIHNSSTIYHTSFGLNSSVDTRYSLEY